VTLSGDFSATLVDEWLRGGVRDAVIAPGSRSSPLSLALVRERAMRTHVRLDERSAGYFALGIALRSGRPVVVLTTSGTAAAELHPAVVEADHSSVPLIVCTADRPPELQSVGAPQTIDQRNLYGSSVRYFGDLGVPDETTVPHWRSFASRLVAESLGGGRGPGPVHANLPFREPFDPAPGTPVPGRDDRRAWHEVLTADAASQEAIERLLELCGEARRGVVIAGRGAGDAGPLVAFAEAFALPLLADSLALLRLPRRGAIAAWDPIVKSTTAAEALQPDLVVHAGAPPASRALSAWQAESARQGARHVFIDPGGRFADPARSPGTLLVADPSSLLAGAARAAPAAGGGGGYLSSWEAAEEAAQAAIDGVLAKERRANEPAVARDLAAALPDDSVLFVSSSMPIRDYDAFALPRAGAPRVLANRGANGIDGVGSTVLGLAAAGGSQTAGLLGDLAFLHDLSALVGGREEEEIKVTYVVVDNEGGGIFDFLPYSGGIESATYERAFSTPQAVDIAVVGRAFGCLVLEVTERSELAAACAAAFASHGISIVLARTERIRNLALHQSIDQSVDEAVRKAVGGL
jgi:2-succinyl-5-enolpyruvyl-6-hydroxy-3-cyclohexene-1-carboxylate synthase